jgi:hypothetical protein
MDWLQFSVAMTMAFVGLESIASGLRVHPKETGWLTVWIFIWAVVCVVIIILRIMEDLTWGAGL